MQGKEQDKKEQWEVHLISHKLSTLFKLVGENLPKKKKKLVGEIYEKIIYGRWSTMQT